MKHIFLIFFIAMGLYGAVVKSPIISVNKDETEATISVDKIDVGVSGFIVHSVDKNHEMILKNAVVVEFDKDSKIAKLKLEKYTQLDSNALPSGKWGIKNGDMAVLAFGYSRGLLIAPNEDIYYKVAKSANIQWIHPDIFATYLSFSGHPTPLRADFTKMSTTTSVGLIYLFLNDRVYTLDAKSFKILTVTEVKLAQESVNLPFYTRVEKIEASWWGEGSGRLKEYEPYYYELIIKANSKNRELYDIVKNSDEKIKKLLKLFEIKE
ncbi:plasminogen-binding N-terminal domain-containing protein [Sulfurimonas sp.]|uniref:plasminogen-binding N-terminal domain-containing protein n=1 Tax=Sulfurimonas sp. TaxID=2022749 RepID=UPI0025F51A1C|nr:plasminogen-binding N-terminal domain-containing protein [Sulfurimonas sp.]MDD5158016.1 plasminogen-binding N-terminal domain-containing protein [Sulfurimonas sp.]